MCLGSRRTCITMSVHSIALPEKNQNLREKVPIFPEKVTNFLEKKLNVREKKVNGAALIETLRHIGAMEANARRDSQSSASLNVMLPGFTSSSQIPYRCPSSRKIASTVGH